MLLQKSMNIYCYFENNIQKSVIDIKEEAKKADFLLKIMVQT